MNFFLSLAVMAGVTYLIRMIPFAYAVLAAMTVPAVFSSAGGVVPSAVGAAVALALAWFDLPLIAVATAAALAAYLTGFFF